MQVGTSYALFNLMGVGTSSTIDIMQIGTGFVFDSMQVGTSYVFLALILEGTSKSIGSDSGPANETGSPRGTSDTANSTQSSSSSISSTTSSSSTSSSNSSSGSLGSWLGLPVTREDALAAQAWLCGRQRRSSRGRRSPQPLFSAAAKLAFEKALEVYVAVLL